MWKGSPPLLNGATFPRGVDTLLGPNFASPLQEAKTEVWWKDVAIVLRKWESFYEQSQVKCSISSKNYKTAHFVEMIIQMGSSSEVAGLQYTTNRPTLLSDPQLFRTKDPLKLSFEKTLALKTGKYTKQVSDESLINASGGKGKIIFSWGVALVLGQYPLDPQLFH